MQDANFNVMAMVDSSGVLTERYEYTPYGQRTVYISPGTNDPDCYAPTTRSKRWTVSSVEQPYGLNSVGHQGLLHDEESGLVYNRARMLDTRYGRFLQSDALKYADGMNYYNYTGSNPLTRVDPTGEAWDWVDFLDHYYWGKGRTINLANVGLLGRFKNSSSVQKIIKDFEKSLDSAALGAMTQQGLDCNNRKGNFVLFPKQLYDVTNDPGLYAVGNGWLFGIFKCNIELTGCKCRCENDNKKYPLFLKYSCSGNFNMTDWFTDPIGIGLEDPRGTPYQITARWNETFFGNIFLSPPCKQGIVDLTP